MFFSKLFGLAPAKKRNPAALVGSGPIRRALPTDFAAPDLQLIEGNRPAKEPAASTNGFDPYNTGAFDRRGTWERTNRR